MFLLLLRKSFDHLVKKYVLALTVYNVLCYGWGCQILRTHFPSSWKYSWKIALSYGPSLKAPLAGETCLIQDHTSLLRQTEPNHFLISSSSCQPKGHASSRIRCGTHSISPSAPSCFFPFPSTDVDLKSTHWETPCILISISEPASQGSPLQQLTRHSSCSQVLIVTCLVVFSSSRAALVGLCFHSALSIINTLDLEFQNNDSAGKSLKQKIQHTVILPSK